MNNVANITTLVISRQISDALFLHDFTFCVILSKIFGDFDFVVCYMF